MKKLHVMFISVVPFFIEGVKKILFDSKYVIPSILSDDLNHALKHINNKSPDILIVDDSCQPRDEFYSFIYSLHRTSFGTKTIVYTESDDPLYLKNLIDHGTRGLLYKKSAKEKMYEAIELINNGGVYIDNAINNFICEYQKKLHKVNAERLSNREKEILRLAVSGFSNKVIADKMFINVKTVETYKERIKRKLEIDNVKELYSLFISNKELMGW